MHKPIFPNISLVGLLFLAQDASATVSMYQTAVQADGDAIHLWSFEGADAMSRQSDSVGTNDLTAAARSTGSTASIAYGTGFDSSSSSVTPQRINSTNGAAFLTSSSINMPTTVSFEAIIQPDAFSTNTAVYSYILAARGATATRNYFGVLKGGATDNQDIINISGDNFGNNQNTVVDNYTAGNWYYIAVTLELVSGNTVVNAWAANLSTGSALTKTVDNQTESGTFVNNIQYGLGALNDQGTSSDFFAGAIDEIALYSTVKDQAFFVGNHALIIPEPSSLLLGAIGFGALFRRRR